MEIYSQNTKYISNLLIKYQNQEIDQKELNNNIFANLVFNHYFFRKKRQDVNIIKKKQTPIFRDFIMREAEIEEEYNKLREKVKQKKETPENAQALMKEKRKEVMNEFSKQKGGTIYVENTFNSYIPPKNMSLSLDFHNENTKVYKRYISESDTKISYQNPALNPRNEKIITSYNEEPYIVDENTDIYILNEVSKNKDKDGDIIQNIKNEKINQLKNIINDQEDDTLFYSEKIDDDDAKNAANWLGEVNDEEIISNFNILSEEKKNNKNFGFNNLFYFESNNIVNDSDPASIFDEIPQYGDRYKKFSQYLSDKSYKNYMKKMNYNYLDVMLLNFFDLHSEFQKYNFLQKEMVAMSFVKKFILNCGICNSKVYDNTIKAISTQKGTFNFENFLDCFTPILENRIDKGQTLKYKFLLSLVKNQNTQIVSMENYKVFCNLIKGKSVFEEENCKKLSKNMVESFKNKFPRENVDDFKFFQIMTIIECLIDEEQ